MKRLSLFLLLLGAVVMPAIGEDTVDGFVARTYQDRQGQTMPYRLFIPPGYKKSRKYPLVLWLHGAGGVGSDNLRQIIDDQVPGTRIWTKPENVKRHPAFVVVPQSSTGWTLALTNMPMVRGILDEVQAEFRIDSHRLYVVGQSMGGVAGWGLITQNPSAFAAAVFVCSTVGFTGGAQTARLPMWIFIGTGDPRFSATKLSMDLLRKTGGNPRYTEYEGAGHDIWDRVFKEPGLVEWVFAQHN